jgi:hypothetical protein
MDKYFRINFSILTEFMAGLKRIQMTKALKEEEMQDVLLLVT